MQNAVMRNHRGDSGDCHCKINDIKPYMQRKHNLDLIINSFKILHEWTFSELQKIMLSFKS